MTIVEMPGIDNVAIEGFQFDYLTSPMLVKHIRCTLCAFADPVPAQQSMFL